MSDDRPILSVEGLRTHFFTRKGVVKAVDDVSFSLRRGEIMGLVGESGAGKSITGFSILRLIDPPGRIVAGRIAFDGEDLLTKSEAQMAKIRGDRIGMVFQDPQTSLDPVFSIGTQLIEALQAHHPVARSEASPPGHRAAAAGWDARAGKPPGRLSAPVLGRHAPAGDDRHCASCNPQLLIADEPTTALDVTIQAQILKLILGSCARAIWPWCW